MPTPTTNQADRLLEAIHMLTIEVKALNATMAKPRLTLTEYRAQQEAEEERQSLARAWADEYARRKREGEAP